VFGSMGAYIAGLFCIVGHMFPAYYRFKGGKGVVTAAITILMCNPLVFLILFVIFVVIVLSTKFISLGSVMCMLLYPLVLDRINRLFVGYSTLEIVFAILMTLLVVLKHKDNIGRLLKGQESKFSLKKSVKKPEDAPSDEQK
jgi:glycerol-3-phosphate acyltransferase PlsY